MDFAIAEEETFSFERGRQGCQVRDLEGCNKAAE